MLLEITIILILILFNGLFSLSELALVSARKTKLEAAANRGVKKARLALKLSESPGKFLSTVQVGITLVGILTGVFGGASIADRLAEYIAELGWFSGHESSVAIVLVVIVITYLTLIFGELLPKRIALTSPEKVAINISGPMKLVSKLATPAVWLLNNSTNFFLKVFKIKPGPDNYVTEEEIKTMLAEASEAGEVEKEERDIVERVFFLGDTDVGSLMTHRKDVVMLNIDDDVDTNKRKIRESVHSNFPVYEKSDDNIIGVVSLKDLVGNLVDSQNFNLIEILKRPLFVPDTMSAFTLLDNMKNSKSHFAIAVDQYGGVKGVISINDLFQVIMGNLYNESREPEIVKRADGSFLVDGLISLDEFFRYFDIKNTEEIEEQGFFTLGGFVLYITKHIPQSSEKFKWRNLSFEIIDMDGNRVDKVLVKLL